MPGKQVIGDPVVIGGRKLSLSRAVRAGDFVFLTGQVPLHQAERVPMTELVRRAVREYRKRYHADGPGRLQELLGQTRGCWTHGDGLRYQDAAREEWERSR